MIEENETIVVDIMKPWKSPSREFFDNFENLLKYAKSSETKYIIKLVNQNLQIPNMKIYMYKHTSYLKET